MKSDLRSDCCMCSSTGMRIILIIASLYKWRIVKADVKNAFLQTGLAQRDVYVISPRESTSRKSLRLLLAAAHGLVNSNSNWQLQSDRALLNMGLEQCRQIPQPSWMKRNGRTVLIIAKIVDEMLAIGEISNVKIFINKVNSQSSIRTVNYLSLYTHLTLPTILLV